MLNSGTRRRKDEHSNIGEFAGGNTYREPKDHGFMYQHGFQDLDGHIWELLHMQDAPELSPIEAASGHIH